MPTADMTILFVQNPVKSIEFYSALCDARVVEVHPSFALMVFENGMQLALWSRLTAEPAVTAPAGGCEIMFTVGTKEELEALYLDWGVSRGITMCQKPTLVDFGYTFTALDPDGHRLRVAFLRAE